MYLPSTNPNSMVVCIGHQLMLDTTKMAMN